MLKEITLSAVEAAENISNTTHVTVELADALSMLISTMLLT